MRKAFWSSSTNRKASKENKVAEFNRKPHEVMEQNLGHCTLREKGVEKPTKLCDEICGKDLVFHSNAFKRIEEHSCSKGHATALEIILLC